MNKKVSVCIATYNGEAYIKEQVESVLTAINKEDEVIISDDNSSDNTIEIIKSFNDPRIKVVYNDINNRGHISNFENALKKSSGDIIFLSDQDDVWHPEKVIKMRKALIYNDLVVCDCNVVDADLNIGCHSFFEIKNSGKGFFKNLHKNTYLGCCMAFKRAILIKSLPFPKDIVSHDTWIGLIGEIFGKTQFIEDKLHYFRRHDSNFSANSGTDSMLGQYSPYSFSEKIKMRIVLVKNIILRFFKVLIRKGT